MIKTLNYKLKVFLLSTPILKPKMTLKIKSFMLTGVLCVLTTIISQSQSVYQFSGKPPTTCIYYAINTLVLYPDSTFDFTCHTFQSSNAFKHSKLSNQENDKGTAHMIGDTLILKSNSTNPVAYFLKRRNKLIYITPLVKLKITPKQLKEINPYALKRRKPLDRKYLSICILKT